MVTIKDIAKIAGVSVSTVSNALNDSDKVVPLTKEAVVKIAQDLGYVPNLNARRLKNRKTHNLGLFLPNFGGSYYVQLVQAMYAACRESKYSLLVHISDSITSQRLSSVILSSNIDGAVILNEHLDDSDIPFLRNRHMPLVFLDKELSGENIASVLIDNHQGIGLALDHLVQTGHRNVTFVRGFPNFDDATRYAAFESGARRLGLDPGSVLWGWFSTETAYEEVLKRSREEPQWNPDAFLCGNDDMAKGCILALKELGRRVPDDVSVIGFDDSDFASYCLPPLTTVVNPVADVGRTAIAELLRLMDGDETGRVTVLETRLVKRESVRQRPGST